MKGRKSLDDYYAGADGARRILTELDAFMQRVLDAVDETEALTCDIELELTTGEVFSLKKSYGLEHKPPAET
jgi:hypothetical protein